MNKEELKDFRKNFYMTLEENIREKEVITKQEYNGILLDAIRKSGCSSKLNKRMFVYMGSYATDRYGITDDQREYLTYEDNPKVSYKLYKEIETGIVAKVNITDVKKFEKENKVIFPKIVIYNIQEFNNQFSKIKIQFYKSLLYNKQKDAYKLVKKINEQK